MADRYYARSASDRTDDWPFWFVADRKRGGLNVTSEVADLVGVKRGAGQVLVNKESALNIAARSNPQQETPHDR